MPPAWLTILAWTYLSICFLCAALIVADVARGYRQRMPIMEWVWAITALYLGPLAVLAYWKVGRTYSPRFQAEAGLDGPHAPYWLRVGVSVTHCGAGCTLGDVIAEWLVFVFALAIAGISLWASYLLDYAFAFVLGIVFQYLAITQMGKVRFGDAIRRAVKSDTISLTSFEVGLFGWMALMFFVFFPHPDNLQPDTAGFWFLMQIGMAIGFATSYPTNVWLIRRGIKEAM